MSSSQRFHADFVEWASMKASSEDIGTQPLKAAFSATVAHGSLSCLEIRAGWFASRRSEGNDSSGIVYIST